MAFLYGTVITSVIAIVIAVPVSVGVALLLTEVVPRRWSRPIVYVIDLLAVVPSVVWGLWGILVLVPWLQRHLPTIASGVNGIPVLGNLFGGPRTVSGASFFTAGIILADHDHPDHHLAVPRGHRDRARRSTRRARTRSARPAGR